MAVCWTRRAGVSGCVLGQEAWANSGSMDTVCSAGHLFSAGAPRIRGGATRVGRNNSEHMGKKPSLLFGYLLTHLDSCAKIWPLCNLRPGATAKAVLAPTGSAYRSGQRPAAHLPAQAGAALHVTLTALTRERQPRERERERAETDARAESNNVARLEWTSRDVMVRLVGWKEVGWYSQTMSQSSVV